MHPRLKSFQHEITTLRVRCNHVQCYDNMTQKKSLASRWLAHNSRWRKKFMPDFITIFRSFSNGFSGCHFTTVFLLGDEWERKLHLILFISLFTQYYHKVVAVISSISL